MKSTIHYVYGRLFNTPFTNDWRTLVDKVMPEVEARIKAEDWRDVTWSLLRDVDGYDDVFAVDGRRPENNKEREQRLIIKKLVKQEQEARKKSEEEQERELLARLLAKYGK